MVTAALLLACASGSIELGDDPKSAADADTDTDADTDADADGDTDADADTDADTDTDTTDPTEPPPEDALYAGHTELQADSRHDSGSCRGDFEITVTPGGEVTGVGDCWFDREYGFEGVIEGWLVPPSFEGVWIIDYDRDTFEIDLAGEILEDVTEIDAEAVSDWYEVTGTLVGERVR
ncbi:MAG: hypothetical protein ACOZNI_00250 [Myxococcota bacterium]